MHFRPCFHVHFIKNSGEKFHPMKIIDCKKFVVLFLAYLMCNGFSVYDGCHLVLALSLRRVYTDRTDFNFFSLFSFTVPTFAFIQGWQITSVNRQNILMSLYGFFICQNYDLLCRMRSYICTFAHFQRHEDFLFLMLTQGQVLLHFRMKGYAYPLCFVQCVKSDYTGKIIFDHIVKYL